MATKKTETIAKPAKTMPKVKKFKNNELIECRSITNGELLMVGSKSGILYRWADYGSIEGVEYQDLLYSAHGSKNGFVKKPCFIILDNDFINQNPEVAKIYAKIDMTEDLRDIIDLSVQEMRTMIEKLPDGARESLRGICSTMIDNGELDSLSKIKALDEIFGTELLLAMSKE